MRTSVQYGDFLMGTAALPIRIPCLFLYHALACHRDHCQSTSSATLPQLLGCQTFYACSCLTIYTPVK